MCRRRGSSTDSGVDLSAPAGGSDPTSALGSGRDLSDMTASASNSTGSGSSACERSVSVGTT
jgi:hypothetical protein